MIDEFPHQVTFQKYTETPDGGGGYTKEWTDLFTSEAHVQPVSSREYMSARQLSNPIDHEIYYPFNDGIKGNMRALWVDRDKTLDLRSNPLDQGGIGEILMVKAQLNG